MADTEIIESDKTALPSDDAIRPVGSDELWLRAAGAASYGLAKTLGGLAKDVASGQITHETQDGLERLQRMNPAPEPAHAGEPPSTAQVAPPLQQFPDWSQSTFPAAPQAAAPMLKHHTAAKRHRAAKNTADMPVAGQSVAGRSSGITISR